MQEAPLLQDRGDLGAEAAGPRGLVDHDGRPTRWAIFDPSSLDHDRDWWEERGLNSLSILAYCEFTLGDAPRAVEITEGTIDMACQLRLVNNERNGLNNVIAYLLGHEEIERAEQRHAEAMRLVAFSTDDAVRTRLLVREAEIAQHRGRWAHALDACEQTVAPIERNRGGFPDFWIWHPQKLNKEIMELYKTYKINPFSGCLPMLLQMPIFIALYQALMKSIELRNAKFMRIGDLSMPDAVKLPFALPLLGDSINILPLVMVGAMVVQQKISTKSMGGAVTEEQKQQQKLMLIIMPIMFGFIFYNMAIRACAVLGYQHGADDR